MKLNFNREQLERFCRERGIARLELFGSALRVDFREDSDVDLLATLHPEARPTLLDWADMQEKLAELFGRPVDLVGRRAIERSRNRYRKRIGTMNLVGTRGMEVFSSPHPDALA